MSENSNKLLVVVGGLRRGGSLGNWPAGVPRFFIKARDPPGISDPYLLHIFL